MMTAMKTIRQLLMTGVLLIAAAPAAAEPAKTLFGVELGSRFAFPPCARGEDTMTSRYCYAAGLSARTAWGTEERHVFYPRPQVVPYARGELVVEIADGVVEAVHVNTWGIEAQGTALEALTAKYGPPTRARSEKIKAHRSRYPSKFAEWDLKDFSVRLDGTTSTIDWGRITLASHRYRQLRNAAAARR